MKRTTRSRSSAPSSLAVSAVLPAASALEGEALSGPPTP